VPTIECLCFQKQDFYVHSWLVVFSPPGQGCQMVCFHTKNPNLGTFWRVLQWKMLVYFMDTWSILRSIVICILLTFGIVRGNLVYFPPFWYFVPRKIWQPCSRIRLKPYDSRDRIHLEYSVVLLLFKVEHLCRTWLVCFFCLEANCSPLKSENCVLTNLQGSIFVLVLSAQEIITLVFQ
jgi:hypothetical protein